METLSRHIRPTFTYELYLFESIKLKWQAKGHQVVIGTFARVRISDAEWKKYLKSIKDQNVLFRCRRKLIENRCPVEIYTQETNDFLLFFVSYESQNVCETTGIFCLSRSYARTTTQENTRRHTLTRTKSNSHTRIHSVCCYFKRAHKNRKRSSFCHNTDVCIYGRA